MAVDVYLMRHGETEANVREVLLGRGDSPFTDAGRRHPLEVARHLEALSLTCVYTSPMARTHKTAAILLGALDRAVPVKQEMAIAEIDAGEYEGLTFQEVRERVAGDRRLGDFRYPGGESWRDVQSRAVGFVTCLSARHESEAVLLVTHAGVIAGLVAHVLKEPIERFIRTRYDHDFLGRLRVENGAIVEYERLAGNVGTWL